MKEVFEDITVDVFYAPNTVTLKMKLNAKDKLTISIKPDQASKLADLIHFSARAASGKGKGPAQ